MSACYCSANSQTFCDGQIAVQNALVVCRREWMTDGPPPVYSEFRDFEALEWSVFQSSTNVSVHFSKDALSAGPFALISTKSAI